MTSQSRTDLLPQSHSPRLYLNEVSLLFLISAHPDRQRLVSLLEDWLRQERSLFTSVFALERLQEILLEEGFSPARLRYLWAIFDRLFHAILPLEWSLLQYALMLQEERSLSMARSLHLALIEAHQISHVIAGHQFLPFGKDILELAL